MKNTRSIISMIVLIIGFLLALYVGGWLMFLKPIIYAVAAFDAGTLTGTIILWTIIKCILASFVSGVISYIGILIAILIK